MAAKRIPKKVLKQTRKGLEEIRQGKELTLDEAMCRVREKAKRK